MTDPPDPSAALLLSRDLFFTSRVQGTAEQLGGRVDVASDIEDALAQSEQRPYCCAIVDLGLTDLDVSEFVERWPSQVPVVAFGAHVNTVRLQQARDAGCREVMPRSRFSAGLADILKRYLG